MAFSSTVSPDVVARSTATRWPGDRAGATLETRLARWNPRDLHADVRRSLALSEAATQEAIALYKQFWLLLGRYPNRQWVPPAIVDWVWHLHILDTRCYRQDCQFLVGEFVDHQPQREGVATDDGDSLAATLAEYEACFGVQARSQLQRWQVRLTSGNRIPDPTQGGECYRLRE